MKGKKLQKLGYVLLGLFMVICYAYVDGKKALIKFVPEYKLVDDKGYFEIQDEDGEMSIFCISKSVRGDAKDAFSFNYIDGWTIPQLEIVADKDVNMKIRIETSNHDILFDDIVDLNAGKKEYLDVDFEAGETYIYR